MPFAVGAVVLIALVLMPLKFHYQGRSKPLELVFKAASTAVALGFAVYRCASTGFAEPYALWLALGLALCLLGDIFLEIRFTVGGALFFLGHVAYVVGVSERFTLTWVTAAAFALAAAGLLPFLYHYRARIPGALLPPLTVYALVLALLLGAALPQPFLALSRQTVLLALGAALFVASDMTLCRNMVLQKGTRPQYVSLLMYYLGQLLLALSVFPA